MAEPGAENMTHQLEVAEHYDKVWAETDGKLGESWESWPFFNMQPSAHDTGIKALGNLQGKKVLDLACGAGYSAVELAEHGASVTALDLSVQGLAATTERAQKHGVGALVETIRSSVEQLPFPDESFDLVFAQNFLMHVSTAKVGQETWRVLKPGGKAVFIEPLSHHPLVKLYRALFSAYKGTKPRWCTREDLVELAQPFKSAQSQSFYLLSAVASMGAIQTRPRLLKPTWAVLNGLDRLIIKVVPPARKMCWVTLTVLEK